MSKTIVILFYILCYFIFLSQTFIIFVLWYIDLWEIVGICLYVTSGAYIGVGLRLGIINIKNIYNFLMSFYKFLRLRKPQLLTNQWANLGVFCEWKNFGCIYPIIDSWKRWYLLFLIPFMLLEVRIIWIDHPKKEGNDLNWPLLLNSK